MSLGLFQVPCHVVNVSEYDVRICSMLIDGCVCVRDTQRHSCAKQAPLYLRKWVGTYITCCTLPTPLEGGILLYSTRATAVLPLG